ncbi:sugar phosphate isomerase/epimerase [Pseudomonas atacamensis]|jgi:sugar phosphate isomerase/epimerase|uniref:sugar phosphate isomerase/epimerase family protein n=1 Tax=Pseudomonas atacamensis TaxID=2565368 RepID=UPI002160D96C|nr:sugar phosphate isomerase/epimerase [Pseudomonas atacamensis]UVL12719.1 sugar phosphate isomerase/epimerase [Pseudomonas atacamensis]
MRLAISNIAWDVVEDEAVARLLNRFSVDAIDIAPSKYFPELSKASDEDISRVKSWWGERGIEITGMQALLFGTSGFNVFGSEQTQDALLEHLNHVCRIGGGLGATRLVFGSPKNRDRSGLSDQQVMEVAIPFFRKLGDIAKSRGVTICLEPNPVCYGANFMTTSRETADVVRKVAHPAIRMQLDTGALTINKECPQVILGDFSKLIGHVHASEPDLLPLGDGGTVHMQMAAALHQFLPVHIVSIEMVATNDEPHLDAIERALKLATRCYRVADMEGIR